MEAWEPYLRLLDRYGLPLVSLIVLVGIIWRVARWLRPRADQVIDGHLAFLQSTSDTNKTQANAIDKLSNTMDRVVATQEKHGEKLEVVIERVDAHGEILNELRQRDRG